LRSSTLGWAPPKSRGANIVNTTPRPAKFLDSSWISLRGLGLAVDCVAHASVNTTARDDRSSEDAKRKAAETL
jgi:hypothetical protein